MAEPYDVIHLGYTTTLMHCYYTSYYASTFLIFIPFVCFAKLIHIRCDQSSFIQGRNI